MPIRPHSPTGASSADDGPVLGGPDDGLSLGGAEGAGDAGPTLGAELSPPLGGASVVAGGDSVDGPNDGLALGGALSQPLGGVVPDWVQLWVGANGAPQDAPNGV